MQMQMHQMQQMMQQEQQMQQMMQQEQQAQQAHMPATLPAPMPVPMPGHTFDGAVAPAVAPAPAVPAAPAAPAASAASAASAAEIAVLNAKVQALERALEDVRSSSMHFFGRVGVPRSFVFADYKDVTKPVSKVSQGEWVFLTYPMVQTQRATDTGTATEDWVRCYSINAATMGTQAFWVCTTTRTSTGKVEPTFDQVKFYPH